MHKMTIRIASAVAVFAGSMALSSAASANSGFCIGNDSQMMLTAQSLNEVGIKIAEVQTASSSTSGKVVVLANNHYGNGAGSEWTSKIPEVVTLKGGKCYNVAMMSKTTQPNGDLAWTCNTTVSTSLPGEIEFKGYLLTSTNMILQSTADLLAQPTQYDTSAPQMNCP